MAITPNTTFSSGAILTATQMNQLPWGIIARSTATAAQNGIGTSATDLTGLSVTWTAVAGRSYRLTATTQFIYASGSPAVAVFKIVTSGGTQVQETNVVGSATVYSAAHLSTVVSPAAGSVTYKVQGNVNSGTMNVFAASNAPIFLMVEDLGTA